MYIFPDESPTNISNWVDLIAIHPNKIMRKSHTIQTGCKIICVFTLTNVNTLKKLKLYTIKISN